MTIVAAVAILGIGGLAAINLYVLNTLYGRSVKASAAQEVVQLGMRLTTRISELPVVGRSAPHEREWREFARIVRSFDKFFPFLEYVSVSEEGVVLFQESLEDQPTLEARPAHLLLGGAPRIGRQLMTIGGRSVSVMTFSLDVATAQGRARTVEVAIRREALAEEESESKAALFHMFRTSLSTIAVGFIASVLIVGWLIRRELRRTQWRRQQENLAFAGAMATGIIHDFRNPMSALRLDLQLLDKETEKGAAGIRPERVEELSGRARSTLDRLDDILKEFQHLARPEQEAWKPVDANACAADCARLMASRFARAGIAIELDLCGGPAPVLASETGMKRALINLLVNAEQASPQGAKVRLRSRMTRRELRVEVADQGPGIPTAMRTKVFDMFVTSKPGGFGLGLPLAKTAIESFGGVLTAGEAPGGGALFEIRLPLAEPASDAPERGKTKRN